MNNNTFIIAGQYPSQKSVFIDAGDPVGFEQLTVSLTGVGLTVPLKANSAIIQIDNAHIRWRDDGTDPTTSTGMLVYQSNYITIESKARLTAIKFIRTASTDAKLNISYYERK